MTQTVFSNDMAAHVWAQQRQQSGRSNNGNLYFDGPTLYSYGSHFPAGVIAADGTVFLNADSYSISTSRHQRAAWAATRHRTQVYLPALDSVRRLILSADSSGRLPAEQRKPALAYLAAKWQRIPAESEGAAWLLRAARSRRPWAAIRAQYERKAEREAERSKAALKRQRIKAGADFAAEAWETIAARAWRNATDYRQRGLREMISDLRADRLATPKRHKRVRAILWQREQALRAILRRAEADSDRYGNAGDATKARALIHRLRAFKAGRIGFVPGYEGPDGLEKRAAALALPTGAGWRALADMLRELGPLVHMPESMRAAMAAMHAEAEARATEAEGAEAQRREIRWARERVLRDLRAFNAGRRNLRRLRESGAWAGTLEAESFPGGPPAPMTNRQRCRVLDSIIHHKPLPGVGRGFDLSPILAARTEAIRTRAEAIGAELEAERLLYAEAWEREQAAERQREREQAARIAAMTEAERLAAWEAGDLPDSAVRELERTRGPLLRASGAEIADCRVTGGTLISSMGAQVPLRHAFRVFQLVAHCRAAGKGWKAGSKADGMPAHIRVGHFTVDSIAPSGDFVAGCHAIQWREVSRLAERLGVAACLAPLAEIMAEEESA